MTAFSKPASRSTAEVNDRTAQQYPLDDVRDFDDARRGLIAELEDGKLYYEDRLITDESLSDFLRDDAGRPPSVDASMWRQAQVVDVQGLFQVTDHLYQFRSSINLTIVDAPEGLVVIDTTSSPEVAAAGLKMFREHVNDKPVKAVIYTHTHWDHYGGIKGVVSEDDVASGRVPIVAPGTLESFNAYAIGENVITGSAMSRRQAYTFGLLLPIGPQGLVTGGISNEDTLVRTQSYIPPTDPVTRTGETRTLAGWEFEFLYAPDTEAPEEMHVWIPAIKALTCAENANHTMHNIQTLRGARTRDARNFARYLDETLTRWGDEAEVHFGPHTWPVFGNAAVREFLEDQRDLYKYIHDQALRLANQGLTPLEAAEQVRLPDALGRKWYNRYYHGGLHHNIRAVFHKELGFWDGDPATVWPLLPAENARRHLDLIGRDTVIAEGTKAIEQGDYRWAVQILHHAVFADPDDTEAKELQADAYEQLGYQMEVPQYRHIFLTAAMELRTGIQTKGKLQTAARDTILAMPVDLLFDFVAVHVVGEKAADVDLRINFSFTDRDETWSARVRHGVLNAWPVADPDASLTLSGTKEALSTLLLDPAGAKELVGRLGVETSGDLATLDRLADVLDTFDPDFPLVTP
jgi:alkyl sulfatase BDS1-like metallo-beta-lactamase superfamily hydrolase